MESLLNEQELNIDLPQVGEIRSGVISRDSPSQILVSIGAKSEGVISGRELDQLTSEEREALQVGQQVHVFVVNPEDANGNVVLSLKRAQEEISWENVERLVTSDEVVDSKITGFNKGGSRGRGRLARVCAFVPDQRHAPGPVDG
jgi:small subunit ribosomal protein S1